MNRAPKDYCICCEANGQTGCVFAGFYNEPECPRWQLISAGYEMAKQDVHQILEEQYKDLTRQKDSSGFKDSKSAQNFFQAKLSILTDLKKLI